MSRIPIQELEGSAFDENPDSTGAYILKLTGRGRPGLGGFHEVEFLFAGSREQYVQIARGILKELEPSPQIRFLMHYFGLRNY